VRTLAALALLSLTLGQSCDMPIVSAGDDDGEVLGYHPPEPPDDLTDDPQTDTNLPPIADAGDDLIVEAKSLVELDGSASSDPEKDQLTFTWTQISGQDIALENASESIARFTAPMPEDIVQLVFSLAVSDGETESTDTVVVEVEPAFDAAAVELLVDAGGDIEVTEGEEVILDGSGTVGPDEASVQWIQQSGTSVDLQNADTLIATFTAPDISEASETLEFELVVSGLDSDQVASDTVSVTVTGTTIAPSPGGGGGSSPPDPCPDPSADSDGDGTPDCDDGCIDDPDKTAPGVCGCGISDADDDGDGVANCNDVCAGFDDTIDSDADGTPDGCDSSQGEPPDPMTSAARTSGKAPLAVFFDAVNSASGIVQPTDGDHSRLHYEWNFDDDPSAVWNTNGRSRNIAVGFVAAHVFDDPGTYTVTLTVTTVDGQVHRYQQDITVESWTGTTYYVSSSTGNDSNNGESPTSPFQSVAKATSMAGTNTHILFKRGDSWSTSATIDMTAAGPGLIGAYYYNDGSDEPTQPKPKFTHAGPGDFLRFFTSARDWRVCDLEFIGLADSGCAIEGFTELHQNLIYRCSSTGFGAAYLWSVAYYDHDQNFIVDSDWTDSWGRGVYLGGKRGALLGNYGHDVGEHVLRVWHSQKFVISDNILHDPATGHSHAIKLHNKPGVDPPTEYVIFSGNSCRGDSWAATFGPQNTTLNELVQHLVIERNLITVQDDGRELVGISVWGPDNVIRNNVVNGTGSISSEYKGIQISQRGIGPLPHRTKVYNNTVYRSDAAIVVCNVEDDPSGVIVKNNVGAVAAGYVSKSYSTYGSPVTAGSNLILDVNGLFVDAPNNDFRLLPGTALIDAAETLAGVREDYGSNTRPIDGDGDNNPIPDIGAHEMQ